MIAKPDVKITELLNKSNSDQNHFTLSAEVIPPRNGVHPSQILRQIDVLTKAGAQFLAVTKGAGGSLRGGSLPIAQVIKESFSTPCIAHFTCRDLLPEEVENQLVDHHFFGIRNILALRGDPPRGVENWSPREGSYPYAYQLVEQIRALNNGRYLERAGYQVQERERTDFCIGVAVYPDHPDENERIDFYKQKVEAGAEFSISQILFDPDSYGRFLDLSAKHGINIPCLPGTQILKSQPQAERIRNRFQIPIPERIMKLLPAEEKNASIDNSVHVLRELADDFRRKGAPGLHLFVLNDTEYAQTALSQLSHR